MIAAPNTPLATLYEQDETAWLEAMASLAAKGRWTELDLCNLSEYLADMAKRDRREVTSRLSTLIAHLLKWRFQPERRGGSWRATVEVQRQELAELLESGTLRNHALEVFEKAYGNAVRQAAAETGLAESTFPLECSFSLEEALSTPLEEGTGQS